MKNIYRKVKRTKLPYKRILAVIMALVMVLSVIYINHTKDRVLAEPDAVNADVTDNTDFLAGLGISPENANNSFTVYVPANGVRFPVPADIPESFKSSETDVAVLYKYTKEGEKDKYLTEVIAEEDYADKGLEGYAIVKDDEDNPLEIETEKRTAITAYWSADIVESSTEGNTVKLTTEKTVGYYIGDDENPVKSESSATNTVATITVKSYIPSAPEGSEANPEKNTAFSDGDAGKANGGSGDTRYYGDIKYSLKKDGTEVVAPTKDWSAINAAVNSDMTTAGDGVYVLSKVVTIPVYEPAIYDSNAAGEDKQLTRDYYVISDLTATYDGSSVGIDSLGTNNHNPSKPVVFNLTTDTDAATITCDPSVPGITPSVAGNTIKIPGDIEYNNGQTRDYTITATAGGITDTRTVSIKYGNGKPKISGETINGAAVSGTVYVKGSFTVSAKAELEDSTAGATLNKVELYKTASDGVIAADASPKYTWTDESGAFEKTVSFEINPATDGLEPGSHYYKYKAYSTYDLVTSSDTLITVCYDNEKPKATEFSATQSSLSFGGSANFGDATSCEVTKKVSALSAVDLSVKVSDSLSGVKSVTFNGVEGTPNGENTEFTYSLPADSSMTTGGSKEISIVVKDLAGNESTYTAKINYYNETIKIETEYTPETKDNIFKWGNGEKKAYLYYKVTSEVPIDKAVYTVNGGSETELTLDTEKSDTANNLYVYKYDFNNTTEGDYTLTFKATSKSGNSASADTKIFVVDLTDPTVSDVSIDSTNSIYEGVDNWYQRLFLLVKVGDDKSGVEKVTAEGTDKTEYTSFSSNQFTAEVKQSSDSSGTPVKFTAYDKAGNKSATYSNTFYVDNTAPVASLKVDEKNYTAVNGQALSSDPKIEYSVTDSISGLPADGLTLKIEYGSTTITKTDVTDSGKKLSEIINTDLSDSVDYKLTLSGKDKAGKKTDVLSTTFRVDSTKPVVTGKITTTAVKPAYSNIFNQDVKIELSVKDSNLKKSNIKITDTVSGKTYSPDWSDITGGYSTSLTFSAEGNYKIEVVATDDAGLEGKWSSSFTIDTSKPDLTAMVDGKVYDKTNDYFSKAVETTVQVADDNPDKDDITVTIKRTPFSGDATTETKTGKGPYTISDEGKYEITYKVVDKAGNENSKTIGFTIDKSKPVPQIRIVTEAVKRDGYYNQASVELAFEISDSTVLAKDVTVTDNGKEVSVNWTSKDGKLTATYTTSSEEKHEVKVAVKDQAGNESSDTRSFVIDRTKPKLTAKVNGKDYNAKDDYFTSNVKTSVVVKDDYEDKADVTTTITCDAFSGDQIVDDYKGKGPFTVKKQGKYTVVYKAVDLAGNERTKTIGFYIDKTKPVGNMFIKSDKPPKFSKFNATYTNKVGKFKKDHESYTYGQYYNKNVTIEFSYFDYSVDSITISDGDEEIIPDWDEKNGLGKGTATITDEGHHVITMTIEDKAGNTVDYESGSKILDFYIDKTAPVVTATVNGSNSSGGAIISTNSQGTVNVTVSDANKDPDDITRVVRSTGGGAGTSKVSEGAQSFANEADYDVQFTAVDKAGNSSAPASVKFRVDKTAPQLSISSNAKDGASNKEVEVTFNIKETFYSDMSSSKIDVYKKVDGQNEKHESTINFMPRSSNDSKTETFKEDGEYRFVFSATDKAGNQASEKYSFILDGSMPVITLSGVDNYDKTDKQVELGIQVDETFYLTNKVKLEGTRTDISGEKTDLKFDDFPASSSSTATLAQMFKEDGIYDITVTSTDKAGNTASQTIHFTIDTQAPVIEDLPEYDGTKVKDFALDKNLEDLVTDLTVCEIQLYMDGSLYDGGTALADGTHVLRIEATDEMGHKSVREFTFVLDTIAPNIIITGVEDGTVLKDATKVTVSVELKDDYLDFVTVNGESLVCSEGQAEVQIDKRGRYTLVAAASDSAGNKTEVTIKFSYGRTLLWLIIAGAAVLLAALGFFIVLGKRRNDRR